MICIYGGRNRGKVRRMEGETEITAIAEDDSGRSEILNPVIIAERQQGSQHNNLHFYSVYFVTVFQYY